MRKAIVIHNTYPYGNNLTEWALKNFPLQSTDRETNKILLDKVRYCQAYAKRKRLHELNRLVELLGLKEGQYEIIDSPHMQLTDDGRLMFCAQDAYRGKKFLRYADEKLYIFRGWGLQNWNFAAPSTVYSDRIPEGEKVTGEDFVSHVSPTGKLIETCELVGGGKSYLDGTPTNTHDVEHAR